MFGVDTNVLIRYLVQDDERQASSATRIFEQVSAANPAFLNNIVMCELVWVLSRASRYEKSLIINVINQLLSTRNIEFENSEVLRKTLRHYIKGNGDFSDYLIGEINKINRSRTTYTFDKKAGEHQLFTLVK